MRYDACIISRDPAFTQFLRLTLKRRLSSVTVSSGTVPPPDAARYVVDLDTCPLPEGLTGEVLCTARHGTRPTGAPYLWADRPFRPTRLLALFGLVDEVGGQDLSLVPDRHAVLIGREEISLSATEYALLATLDGAKGDYVTREELLRAVWGDGEEDGGIASVYIHYLRRKIEKDGVKRIFSSRGRGYRLGRNTEC